MSVIYLMWNIGGPRVSRKRNSRPKKGRLEMNKWRSMCLMKSRKTACGRNLSMERRIVNRGVCIRDVEGLTTGPESIGLDVTFVGYEHVYGIPEHAAPFSLKSTSS